MFIFSLSRAKDSMLRAISGRFSCLFTDAIT